MLEEENQEKMEVKQKIKLEEKLEEKQEIEIIKNYAKNCGFKECKTWCEINDCFAELQRKNSALMRDLPEDSSWKIIDKYDQCNENINKCFNVYKPNKPAKYIKKDIIPDESYDNYYYNTCD
tara:strand:+ start:232 stop:597 length:366 start_codon:yes stop_codon:yes gene_type:complete